MNIEARKRALLDSIDAATANCVGWTALPAHRR